MLSVSKSCTARSTASFDTRQPNGSCQSETTAPQAKEIKE